MKTTIQFLITCFLLFPLANSFSQVNQFPQVFYNGEGSTGTVLKIRSTPSLANENNVLTTLSTVSQIGAIASVNSTEADGPATWAEVCLPSTNGTISYGYILYGQYFARINQSNNYAVINTTNLNIRIGPGINYANITINGSDATFSEGSIVALTGNYTNVNGVNWYEVYLPNNCSQITGFVSGDYIKLSTPQNYYIAAGTVNNVNNVSIWGATITLGSLATTNSTVGFYQYKVPTGWNGNITCANPNYNISTPPSYQYTASNSDYNLNFVLSNSNCSAPVLNTPAVISSSEIVLSWNNTGASSYTLYYSDQGCNINPSSMSTTVPSANITGLLANTTYYFWVQENTCNLVSACTSATTNTGCTVPNSPTSLPATAITTTSFTANWNVVDGAASYNIDVATDAAFSNFIYNNIFGSGGSIMINSLACNTTYYYRVRASNSCGTSLNSSTISATTSPCCNAPTVQNNTPTSVNQGSTLYLSASSNDPNATFAWTGPGGWTATGANPTITNVTSSAQGSYCVTATNQQGCSSSAGCVTVTVNAASQYSIAISSSVIPPWQRQGNVFSGSVTVDLSNAGPNATWHLEADYFDQTGYIDAIIYPSLTSSQLTQNFSNATDPKLGANAINGRYFTWNAVLESNGSFVTAPKQTNIIEEEWENRNFVYYNTNGQLLNIPLEYFSSTTSITYSFSRVALTSTQTDNIPAGSIAMQGNGYISEDYLTLHNVSPGVFNVTITYNGVLLNGVTYTESGQFELTKIGNVNNILHGANFDPNKIVILIGGINNNIESDIQTLAENNIQSESGNSWSIANDMTFGNYYNNTNYNTWYIATCNINSIQKNAYDIGISIDSIIHYTEMPPFNSSNSNLDLNIIAHSKGGLEVRTMLDNIGIPLSSTEGNYNYDANNYNCQSLTPYLHSINFLGTPHRGANSSDYEYIPTWNFADNYALGATDLHTGSSILNFLNSPSVPALYNLRIGNITGYGEAEQPYSSFGDDGVVLQSSSESPNIPNENIYQYYIKDGPQVEMYEKLGYDNLGVVPLPMHVFLPSSVLLDDVENTCIENNNPGTSDILDKIVAIINNSNIQSSCSAPVPLPFTGVVIGSVLPNANVTMIDGNNNYASLGKTDENGIVNFNFYDVIPFNDTILISASGIDSMKFNIDSNMIKTHSFIVPMFHTTNSTALTEASVSLLNTEPVTTNPTVQFTLSAQNANHYLINNPINQDSTFVPLAVTAGNIATVSLDTGINYLDFKFIGNLSDTADITKVVYYYPPAIIDSFTSTETINADSSVIGAKLIVDNEYFTTINKTTTTIPLLIGYHTLKFNRYGYSDSIVNIDTVDAINIQLLPVNYSDKDSSTFDFTKTYEINYWKNISLLDSSKKSIVSVKQYNDSFPSLALVPESRKFEMLHLNSQWSDIKFASALDQINNLSSDSTYLMQILNDTSFTKILFDASDTIAGYDSTVQKLSYNYINFNNGNANKEALIIMKRLAPILNVVSSFKLKENESISVPCSYFFTNPDSIKNDMNYQLSNPSSQLNIQIIGDSLIIKTSCSSVNTSFTLLAEHDGLWKSITDSVVLISNKPVPSISIVGDTTFCENNSVTLTANPYNNYLWSNGETSQSVVLTKTGKYSVIEIDSSGCAYTSRSVTITVNTLPVVNAGNDATLLYGGNSILGGNPTASGNAPFTYNWQPVTGLSSSTIANPDATPQDTTTYTVHVTDANGCVSTGSATLNIVKCKYSISDSSYQFNALGGEHTLNVNVNSDLCVWLVNNTSGWLQVTPKNFQKGSGTISIMVDSCFEDSLRTATFAVAGFIYTVTQQCQKPGLDFIIYPNPTNNNITVSGAVVENADYQVTITDMLGRNLSSYSVPVTNHQMSKQINMQGFASGLYFIKIQSTDFMKTYKVERL